MLDNYLFSFLWNERLREKFVLYVAQKQVAEKWAMMINLPGRCVLVCFTIVSGAGVTNSAQHPVEHRSNSFSKRRVEDEMLLCVSMQMDLHRDMPKESVLREQLLSGTLAGFALSLSSTSQIPQQ